MEIKYYGANCVKITGKKNTVIIDDNLSKYNLKSILTESDLAIDTCKDIKHSKSPKFLIDGPGEYEISGVSVTGIPARAHIDEEKTCNATIYRISLDGFDIGVLGHIYPDLSDEQFEKLGMIDVLIVPVGGNGFTIDSHAATQLIKQIEPKFVVPTHFYDDEINYEVPQTNLETFLKEFGVSDYTAQDSLKIKDGELSDKTEVVILNRIKS